MKKICYVALILFLATLHVNTESIMASEIDSETISLSLQEVPVTTVLNMLAEQKNLNLVVSGDITGNVTLRLEDVAIPTALEAILSPGGYNYFIKDGVIIVKSFKNYAPGELAVQSVTLKYLNATTAAKALDPVKSSKGQIIILDRSSGNRITNGKYTPNRILLSDFPNVVDQMVAIIKEMDTPERLISIEVKIIETNIDSETKLGLTWPTVLDATLGGRSSDSSSSTTSTTTSGMNNSAGSWNPNNGDWTWSTLTVAQLNTVLDILDRRGNSKLISNPRMTTLENHEAEMRVETIVPIPTISRFTEGAATSDILTFQDQEVGISLLVTARINGNNQITMDVYPKVEDIIGFAGPPDSQKPITISRSVRTTITVKDGETAALGGLLK